MLQVVVCLKQCVSSEEFDKDTAYAPDITWKRPSQAQDNLWRPIMPGGDNRGVIFILEGRRAEVNQSDLCVEEDFALGCLPIDGSRRGGYSPAVGECLVCIITEQDVFRF